MRENRADVRPPESPWEEVSRAMAEAEVIEKLAALYREGGRTYRESLEMAVRAWRERAEAEGKR